MQQSFIVIWLYWYKRYIKQQPQTYLDTIKHIDHLKINYHLECVEQPIIDKIKLKLQKKPDEQPTIYIISPLQQLPKIESILRQLELDDMISQLYSYYANVESGYLIGNPTDIAKELQEYSTKYYDENEVRNDSLIDSYEKIQNKIDELEMGSKLGEFEGVQLIQCKYKDIPHTFIRVKKTHWIQTLNLINKIKLHPSQPKTITPNLPILPRLTRFRPNPNKLNIFTSYIEQLSHHYPTYSPSIQSIYEYNGIPYIFVQDDGGWQIDSNYALICYYVAYGDAGGTLTQHSVECFLKQNPNGILAKCIQRIVKARVESSRRINKVENEKIAQSNIW